MSERIRDSYDDTLYKSTYNFTLLYLIWCSQKLVNYGQLIYC